MPLVSSFERLFAYGMTKHRDLYTIGGKVFDVWGQAIDGLELRQLLIEAIRYGNLPETRAKLKQIVSNRLNRDRLQELLSEKVLVRNAMDITKIQGIR